mgnify:FL=1
MSIRESLAAAMAGEPAPKYLSGETSSAEEQVESAPVEENEELEAAPVEPDETVSDDTDEVPETEEGTDEPETRASAAPEHWSSDDKDEFEALPDEARDFVLRRYKNMEGDYTEKTKALADDRGRFEKLDQVLAPHREQFARSGVDEAAAVAQLLQAQKFLQTQPVEALRWLAKSAGVDPSQLGDPAVNEEDPDEWVDPQVKQLQQRLNQQESYLASLQEQQNRERHTEFLGQVQGFHEEKTADGELAHPYMETVMSEMTGLLKSRQSTSLQDAYDKAIWMVPEVREKVLNSSKEQRTADQTRRVKRAKRAGREVKSETAPVEPNRSMSLRETLQKAMAASQ